VTLLGGDGSLGCFIEAIKGSHTISNNLESLTFVTLPYGTGNDLCRAMGWGGSEGAWANDLELLISLIVSGERDRLALWEVEINARTLGYKGKERVLLSNG
jgi:diacylglycerol kinase family enzyme